MGPCKKGCAFSIRHTTKTQENCIFAWRSFQRGGCLPNPARIALLLEESHLRGGPVLLRQSPCAGGTRKRGGASRRAPVRSATQIFLITTAAPFPRRSYCSSKNVRESPSKFSEKVLCTKKPYSVHLTGRCVFCNAKITK